MPVLDLTPDLTPSPGSSYAELVALLPSDITAGVTTGHVGHSEIYKQLFQMIGAGGIGGGGGSLGVSIAEFGGVPGIDCSDAFDDAIEAAIDRNIGIVTVPTDPGEDGFIITREILFPEGVDFVGISRGGPWVGGPTTTYDDKSGTWIDAQGEDAGFAFEGYATFSGNFKIGSSDESSKLLMRTQRVNATFGNITIGEGSKEDDAIGWLCTSQNTLYYQMWSWGHGVCGRLDGGAATNLFLRCHWTGASKCNMDFTNEITLPGQFPFPTMNNFVDCHWEYQTSAADYVVDHRAGLWNSFVDCTFFGDGGATLPVLLHVAPEDYGLSQCSVRGGIFGAAEEGVTGISVDVGSACHVEGTVVMSALAVGFSGYCIIQGNPAFNDVDDHYEDDGLPTSPHYERRLAEFAFFGAADHFATQRATFLGTEVFGRKLETPTQLAFGSGAGAVDQVLQRYNANAMEMSDGLVLGGPAWAGIGLGGQVYIGPHPSDPTWPTISFGAHNGNEIVIWPTTAGVWRTCVGYALAVTRASSGTVIGTQT